MQTVATFLARLWRDIRGVAATEFALILPVGLLLLYGTAESGYVLLLDRKITSAVQSAADLVAQEDAVTDADLDDILTAVNNILRPYPTDNLTVSISSVSMNDDGDVVLDWIYPADATSPLAGAGLPSGLISVTGESVIVSQMSYPYSPNISSNLFSGFTISDNAYLRPRNGDSVAKD